MSTFEHDHALPKLSIATLENLCAGIPNLAAPLLSETDLTNTLAALADFAEPGGDGVKLHQALVRYVAARPGNASWLRPLWDDMYLAWREPLPLNLNYFFRLETEAGGGGNALPDFLLALARVAGLLAREELEPEASRSGFFAMDQARTAFYTRIPSPHADILLPTQLSRNPAIAVTCRGFWFLLQLRSADGRLPGREALAQTLQALRVEAAMLASSRPAPAPLGAMTCAARDEAYGLRAFLRQNPVNRLSLEALEQSLLVLCLDPPHASEEKLCRSLLGGPASGRWFDKSLQVIATENQGLGVNLEHAGCDAGIWAYVLSKADALIRERDAARDAEGALAEYRLLEWDIPEGLATKLQALEQDFASRTRAVDLAVREYPHLSRGQLKGLRTSPDAFLQLAFQAAQYRIFGRLRSSYEAVSMRGYAEGRTECARGCSSAALSLARAVHEGGEATDKLVKLYRIAERAHLGRIMICQRCHGVERYMYGLQKMFALYGDRLGIAREPALFSDPGWKVIKHDALSTSGMAAEGIRSFGFAPVVGDGFGVGYTPGKSCTGLVITSFRQSGLGAAAFADAFASAADAYIRLLSK